jgi:hypothetical protein
MKNFTPRLRSILTAIALLMFASIKAAPAKADDGIGFAHKICGIYEAPTEHATFSAGAGCTWLIGDGDVGTTRTEIMMIANRNLNKEALDQQIEFFNDLPKNMAIVPGFRVREFQINCNTIGASGTMVFWGIPSKSNITGYAVCGNHILWGTIHTPPESEMDTELVFQTLMSAMVPLLG